MLNTTFPPWPDYSSDEVSAVASVLSSGRVNYWTGTVGREFEREYASWVGVPYAVALNNGTVALEIALRSLGIGAGDEVVVTPRSFIASASCVISVGAAPVFADVDRETQNISAESVAPVITSRTRAILAVHLAGMPCDLDPLVDLARSRKLALVEDCAQAHGARYKERSVGAVGDVGVWSFCQDKIISTAGEGGMLTTAAESLWSRMWSDKDHGKSWRAVYERPHPPGFRWQHESFGTNGRMLEVQAAVGRLQLTKVDRWSAVRREYANRIWDTANETHGVRTWTVPTWARHAAYRAYVFIEPNALRQDWSRDRVIAEIVASGVPCYAGSCPEIYLEKAFESTPWRPARRLPHAKELGETSLMFLVHPTLRSEHIDLTCATLRSVMRRAVR